MYNIVKKRHSWLLGWQGSGQLHAGGGLHRLPAFLGLQDAVQLLQLSNDVILDVWSWDLQADTATVKGSCEVTRKHLIDHPSHHRNDLLRTQSTQVSSEKKVQRKKKKKENQQEGPKVEGRTSEAMGKSPTLMSRHKICFYLSGLSCQGSL